MTRWDWIRFRRVVWVEGLCLVVDMIAYRGESDEALGMVCEL